MEESERSHIYPNEEFAYWKIQVMYPMRDENGNVVKDKKGKPVVDKDKTDTDVVPYLYKGGIDKYYEEEILPYTPDAWIEEKKTQIGYEINFNKYFYNPKPLRDVETIVEELKQLELQTDGLLDELLYGGR